MRHSAMESAGHPSQKKCNQLLTSSTKEGRRGAMIFGRIVECQQGGFGKGYYLEASLGKGGGGLL